MGSYPVPGEWFENVADPAYDEPDYFLDDALEADERAAFAEDVDLQPGRRFERVEPDPVSDAVHQLRRLASRLAAERHPLAHVPQQVANQLVNDRGPAPRPAGGFVESPTGNCERCGRPLPLPTVKPGRPRKLCTVCSPRRG